MKAAIMQPYLFPYLGYFQLLSAVDLFVFYDDVAYINRGWINRNRLLLNNEAHFFTVPCNNASQNRLINEIETALDEKTVRKLLASFTHSYAKAPQYKAVMPLVETVLKTPADSIGAMAINSILAVSAYLDLKPQWRSSSTAGYHNQELKKEQRLIDICKLEGCNLYRNPIGGQALYTKEMFAPEGIELQFVKSLLPAYKQYGSEFIAGLSIIDVLMFNDIDSAKGMLSNYEIL